MTLTDTVQIATTTTNGYGDKTVTVLTNTKALFIQRTGYQHLDNGDGVTAGATVYLDPTNTVVVENLYRLEGMYIISQQFGDAEEEAWYRITDVNVAQRKLLDNTIDNVYCQLEKVVNL